MTLSFIARILRRVAAKGGLRRLRLEESRFAGAVQAASAERAQAAPALGAHAMSASAERPQAAHARRTGAGSRVASCTAPARAPRFAKAVAMLGAVALAVGCSNADPLRRSDGKDRAGETIVVGSQDYYSNEIIAEIYAQALEAKGYKIERQMKIGQREVYMPEVRSGSIDVFPEYTGNLLQYIDSKASVTAPEPVYRALEKKLPRELTVLNQAPAADQDSYVVTAKFASENGIRTIGDLAKVKGRLVLGGNSELESRPYGPKGLKSAYGVDVSFTPIEDSGGPLTIKSLREGRAQVVDLYSGNPELSTGEFVVLQDPKNLFLSSHVVPLVSSKLPVRAARILDRVSAKLTSEDLRAMGARSVKSGQPASKIAKDWLKGKGLG